MDLTHTILSMADVETPERVRCRTCGSEHRYIRERSAPRPQATTAPRAHAPSVARDDAQRVMEVEAMEPDELVSTLRELLEAAGGMPATRIGQKWEGGTLVMRPGKAGLQEKEVPIETFFRKIVMVRDRLRVLEQQVNASDKLSDADKLGLQQYITRCYGSLTTFNVLFDDRQDWFVGESQNRER
jgi:hypothetical protein